MTGLGIRQVTDGNTHVRWSNMPWTQQAAWEQSSMLGTRLEEISSAAPLTLRQARANGRSPHLAWATLVSKLL